MARGKKETSFSSVPFFFFFKRKSFLKFSRRFSLTPHWLELDPCHHLNQLLSGGMGSWPIPGAGVKGTHRRPTVSAFPRLPLPWTSDSKALPKKIQPHSSKPPLHRRRGIEFWKNEWIFVCRLYRTLKHSQWARLCGLGLSYGAWRAVQGCWRLIA